MKNEFMEILEPIAELLERKNADYGASYDETREEFGPTAFVLRFKDKYNRVKKLTGEGKAMVNNESIEDTIEDVIGYCTLELRYRRRTKNG